MVAHSPNGERIAALEGCAEVSEIEVMFGHQTRRRICRQWPRLELDIVVSTSRRVSVVTPDGQKYKSNVYFAVRDGYVIAYAVADDPGRNVIDPDKPGDFPRCVELQAEALALGMI